MIACARTAPGARATIPPGRDSEELLNWQNIRAVLGENPYFLFLKSGYAAEGLDYNLVRAALASGCIGAVAPTGVLANNGVNCAASVEDMQAQGNFFYFDYCYFEALDRRLSRSRALLAAQQGMEAVLSARAEQPLDYAQNYQYGYHNLLVYQYLGILDPDADSLTLPGEVPDNAAVVGSEQICLTQGREVGEPVALDRSLFQSEGSLDAVLDDVTAVELDNAYVRFRLSVRSPSGGIYGLAGMYARYAEIGEGYAVPCGEYVLVADVAKIELQTGGDIGFWLVSSDGRAQKVWLITGTDRLT